MADKKLKEVQTLVTRNDELGIESLIAIHDEIISSIEYIKAYARDEGMMALETLKVIRKDLEQFFVEVASMLDIDIRLWSGQGAEPRTTYLDTRALIFEALADIEDTIDLHWDDYIRQIDNDYLYKTANNITDRVVKDIRELMRKYTY